MIKTSLVQHCTNWYDEYCAILLKLLLNVTNPMYDILVTFQNYRT